MGVMSAPRDRLDEPAVIKCTPTSLEPAYVTSCECVHLCAPPGLEANDIEDTIIPCVHQEPKKVNCRGMEACTLAQGSIEYDHGNSHNLGNSLKMASNYAPQFENSLWHVPPAFGPAGNPWLQRQSVPWPWVDNHGVQVACQQDVQGNNCMPPLRRGQRNRAQKRHCMLLIASQLNQLQDEDPRQIIIVRRINRLGFESASILREHYGRYGPVAKVLLSNPHEKQSAANFPMRLRPSGIGYVLFETVEGAARALAEGETHVVADVEISVRAFERRESFSSTTCSGSFDASEQTDVPEAEIKDDSTSVSSGNHEGDGTNDVDSQYDVLDLTNKTGKPSSWSQGKKLSWAQLVKHGLRDP